MFKKFRLFSITLKRLYLFPIASDFEMKGELHEVFKDD